MERDTHIDQLSEAYVLFCADHARRVVNLVNSGGARVIFGSNGQSRELFSIDNCGDYPTYDALSELVREVISKGVVRS